MTLDNKIIHAIKILKASGVVAFPTETVYGLGANAEDIIAISKVFALKNRPLNHPLIVHISSIDKLNFWAKDISNDAMLLAKNFWPGPLTLILPKQPNVMLEITGGQNTVALRVPEHPLTLALLRDFNGLVGPSANKHGHVSPTRASHVVDDLGSQVDYVLDGGPCVIGYESTIVDCSTKDIRIMRQGKIKSVDIERVLGKSIVTKPILSKSILQIDCHETDHREADRHENTKRSVVVPGSMLSHYAPAKPLLLVEEQDINTLINKLNQQHKTFAVLSVAEIPHIYLNQTNISWFEISSKVEIFGQMLYAKLREIDKLNIDCMVIVKPHYTYEWSPILDRLERASYNSRHFLAENNL